MPNGIAFPKFPELFTEEDRERMEELERLAKEQQRAYRGLVPWKKKPVVERVARRIAEKAYAPPEWFRAITPWEERGFTPEQAEIYIRETEEELLELRRREVVARRASSIMDYITALAAEGLLTGEEAQLYELIPELNPSAGELERLNLTEEERGWFLEYSESLVGKSREEVYRLYAEGGFPAPKSVAELVDLVKTVIPEPRQVLTTISLSRDLEDITAALQEMYAPQVEEGYVPALENINTELKDLGLEPTGDVEKDIKALEDARAERVKEEGIPVQVVLGDGEVINVKLKDGRDVYTDEGVLIAHYNSETEELVPVAEPVAMPVLDEKERRALYDQRIMEVDEEYADMSDWTVEGWQERRKADPDRFQAWQDARTVAFNDWQYGHLGGEPSDPWAVLQVFGVGLTKLPQQLAAAILQAVQGEDGASVVDRDWADRFIVDAEKDLNQFVSEMGEKYEGRMTTEVAQFPRNLAFSLTSMGAGLGVGIPVALIPVPGARVAAYVTGTAASGYVAYQMTTYQIVQMYLELKNEESKAELGRELTLDEENKLKQEFSTLATKYGLWEAIPEAISNLLFVNILTTPLSKVVGKYLAVKIIAKITALYGQELLTETITQKGQSALEIEAGLREEKITWAEAFKEIAPQTFLLTTVMGGAGTVVISSSRAIQKIKASLKNEIGEDHPHYEELEREALSKQAEITKPVEEVPAVPEVTEVGLVEITKPTDFAKIPRLSGIYEHPTLGKIELHVSRGRTRGGLFNFYAYDAEGNEILKYKPFETAEDALNDILKRHPIPEVIPKPPAVEVAKPPTREEVQTEEIEYRKERMVAVDKESATIRESYRVQNERLEALKEAKAPAYEIAEIQETIKNLEGTLRELTAKKAGVQSKLDVLEETEVTPEEVVPSAKTWGKMSYSSKLSLAETAGIARTAVKLPWSELTGVQKTRLRAAVVKVQLPIIDIKGLTVEEIQDGKGVNKEARSAQAEGSGDIHFDRIPPEEIARTREEAIEHLDALADLSTHVDIINPLHKALGYAWRLGDITAYVDALPSSFEPAQEFLDGSYNESDTPMWNIYYTQSVLDAFAVIDNGVDIIAPGQALARKYIQLVGELGGLAQQNIAQAWAGMVREATHLSGIHKPRGISRKAWRHSLFMLGNELSRNELTVPVEGVLARGEIQEIVSGYAQEVQESMVSYCQLTSHLLHNVFLPSQNAVREKLGRDLIPEMDKYLPWVKETNVWGNLFGYHLKPDFIMETVSMPDFIKPNAPFNARALSRKAGMGAYEKVENIEILLMDYIGVATRDMFFTPVVLNSKAYAKAFRKMGQEVPAAYVERWALERYAGVPNGWTKAWNDAVPQFITRPLAALNRSLTRAVFPLNFQWNLIIQPSSTALGILRYGAKNIIKGIDVLWNPEAQAMVRESYSHILKSRGRGSVVHQDMGQLITEAHNLRRGKLETAADYANFVTRWLELKLTDVSSRSAYYDGVSKGMKPGFELSFYTGDGGSKVQSLYDPAHVPGAINTPIFKYFVRFQTFAFEALTRVRELANIKWLPKAGAYQTVATDSIQGQALTRIRLRKFFEFMVAMWVINIVGDLVIDRKPWEISSFLPAASLMMLSVDPHKSWNLPIPMRYVEEMWGGFGALMEYGNWEPLAHWALRWHTPGGIAASRTIKGITVVIDEGSVEDVASEEMYKIEPDEYIQAIIMGPWQTPTGREYSDRMFEDVDETIHSILKKLEDKRDELGTSVEGKYQTLGGYLSDVDAFLMSSEEENRNLLEKLAGESGMKWTGLPQYLVLDEGSGFNLLTQFAVYCDKILWEEYYEVSPEYRLRYRKSNPYIDASLYFWEKTGTLRSEEAEDYLKKLFEQFIPDNLRAHWRGLPEIPEEIKLLPD